MVETFQDLTIDPFYYFLLRCITTLTISLGGITALTLLFRYVRAKYNARRKRTEPTMPFRTSVEMFLISSHLDKYIDFVQGAISLVSVLVYVYGTYRRDGEVGLWYPVLDMAIAFFFTFNWVLEFYLSKNRLLFAYSGLSIVDILTVAPLFWDLFTGKLYSELQDFRLMRAVRVLRIMRMHKLLPYITHEVYRSIAHAAINIFSLVFCISGLEMVVELNSNTGMPMQFHESVYWCIVTMATVGYGDVHPNTAEGMFITDVLILLSIVLIPFEVNVISAAISSFTPFKRDLSSTDIKRHVVVCGEITYSGLLEFLAEIYSQQRGKMKTEVVILSPKPVSQEINALLNHPFYSNRVIYLQGSAMNKKDLTRAKISRASSCFIFSPEFWCSTDSPTIMAALSLREACTEYQVFAQIISSDARSKIVASGVSQHLCREEFRMALLAQSCLCPGLSTLIANFFASRPRIFQKELWLREYTYGSMYSIFRIEAPDVLVGKSFRDTVLFMYFAMKCLPIGVEIEDQASSKTSPTSRSNPNPISSFHARKSATNTQYSQQEDDKDTQNLPEKKSRKHVLLNPSSGDLVLSKGDVLYVLAQNKKALVFDEDEVSRLDAFRQEMANFEIQYLPTGFQEERYKTAIQLSKASMDGYARSSKSFDIQRPPPGSFLPKVTISPPSVIDMIESLEAKIERGQQKIAKRLLKTYQTLPEDLPPAFIDINKSKRLQDLAAERERKTEERRRARAEKAAAQQKSAMENLTARGGSSTSAAVTRSVKFHESSCLENSEKIQSSSSSPQEDVNHFDFFGAAPTTVSFHGGDHHHDGRLRSHSDPEISPITSAPPAPAPPTSVFDEWAAQPGGGEPSDLLRRVCEMYYGGDWNGLLADAKKAIANRPEIAAKLQGLVAQVEQEISKSQQQQQQQQGLKPKSLTSFESEDDLNSRPMRWGITKSTSVHDFSTPRGRPNLGGLGGGLVTPISASGIRHRRSSSSQHLFLESSYDVLPKDNPQTAESIKLENAIDLDFKNHIVVCGGIKSLQLFVKPLRAKYLKTMKPIVILNPEEPSEEAWAQVLKFPEIYFIQGSGTKSIDLKRARVELADQIVILSDPYTPRATEEEVDRSAILTYLELQGVDTEAKVVIEVVHETNLRYVASNRHGETPEALAQQLAEKNLELTKPLFYLLPEYASGQVCAFSFLDSLFCKAFYQDFLFDLAFDFTFGINMPRKHSKGRGGSEGRENKFLCQVEVPLELVGCTYGELLKDFVINRAMLPLGLYRCKEAANAPTPYVFTCPQESAPVHPDDKVFVISSDGRAVNF